MSASDEDLFYDAVYLPTTRPWLTDRLSQKEADVLERLLEHCAPGPVLDLGCGHGRHLKELAARGFPVVGLDRSMPALRQARSARLPVVRGDLDALPFAGESFTAAFGWYGGLLVGPPESHPGRLAEVARVLRPDGVLLHDGADPVRLAQRPEADGQASLPGGAEVEERCVFDPETGVETGWRKVTNPDGTAEEGRWQTRHPTVEQWQHLLEGAGLKLVATFDELGRPYRAGEGLDLLIRAYKPAV